MLKITDFTFDELVGLYTNCNYHLDNTKLTVPQRQEILKDQAEIYYAMELKIPDSHINQIIDMKTDMQDRYYKKVSDIDAKYLKKMKDLDARHNLERIKDLAIAMGLAIAIVATIAVMSYYAAEINEFFKALLK